MNRLLIGTALIHAAASPHAGAAGVTLVTHGFNSNADGWVLGMASSIPDHPGFNGTNNICYEVTVAYSGGFQVTAAKIAGGRPTNDPNAEIFIKLDWGSLAGFLAQYDTYEVAAAVVPRLLQTNFIAELGGHALAELPLHLIGHSRGASLVCQMGRLLGTNGVWVDQITTLDPHPINEDGNDDLFFSIVDAPLRIFDNVLFADNFYQEFGGYPHGQFIPSSYNRQFSALPGGYSSAHSDTHLWYHATIDLENPANDTEASLNGADRAIWFNTYETLGLRAGFHYSRLAGGDRQSLDRPAGPNGDSLAYGYNQRWDFGAGVGVNRTPLPANHGNWPNPIQCNLAGSNLMAQGQSNALTLYYQWAKPASSNATVTLSLDPDFNPFNGNERLVREWVAPGTTSNGVTLATLGFEVASTNSVPGVHSLLAKITGGGRTRYQYAPERLTVVSSFQPPILAIARETASRIRVEVRGVPGQRVVLQSATNLLAWQARATNWLDTEFWSYYDTASGGSQRFYRAVLE